MIQHPNKKTKVALCLMSEQGMGKNIVLDLFRSMMGMVYYYSTSTTTHILGDFNKDVEGKILINLNEAVWGGDKKLEGKFKEFITDSHL